MDGRNKTSPLISWLSSRDKRIPFHYPKLLCVEVQVSLMAAEDFPFRTLFDEFNRPVDSDWQQFHQFLVSHEFPLLFCLQSKYRYLLATCQDELLENIVKINVYNMKKRTTLRSPPTDRR